MGSVDEVVNVEQAISPQQTKRNTPREMCSAGGWLSRGTVQDLQGQRSPELIMRKINPTQQAKLTPPHRPSLPRLSLPLFLHTIAFLPFRIHILTKDRRKL
ncbi:hypothetical protein RND81_04G087900 [Saponaria officinalis]|uniref:Uncharacterized protein n=1 Tax=Saponaria officinalis TaxID=3572 RepID=A0AAW1LDQ4_SAPOF